MSRQPRLRQMTALVVAAFLLCACKADLYTGLAEQEANEMIAVLMQAGIPAWRRADKRGTVTVQVDEAQFLGAVEALKARGYPRRTYSNLGEVFQGNGFVVSQTEERARFIYAMSEELSRTISEIDGVLSARTHVVLPATDPLSRTSTPSSASVFIRYTEGSSTPELASQIKLLVANSIEGLEYDNVSVGFVPVATPAVRPPPSPPSRTVVDDLRGGMIGFAVGSAVMAMLGGLILAWRRWSGRRHRDDALVATPAE